MATGMKTGLEIPHAGNQDSANFTESGEINMANVRQYIASLYVVRYSTIFVYHLFFFFRFLVCWHNRLYPSNEFDSFVP